MLRPCAPQGSQFVCVCLMLTCLNIENKELAFVMHLHLDADLLVVQRLSALHNFLTAVTWMGQENDPPLQDMINSVAYIFQAGHILKGY
jgi:hypothetical protein